MRRSHEPAGYSCPFCRLLSGESTPISTPDGLVYRDSATAVLVAPHGWETNPGNLLVIPIDHVENLYDLPSHLAGPLLATARRAARALVEVHGCDGTSLRQHNEPAGGQDVWHLHVHVVPRWNDDAFHRGEHRMRAVGLDEQHAFAGRLRAAASWRDQADAGRGGQGQSSASDLGARLQVSRRGASGPLHSADHRRRADGCSSPRGASSLLGWAALRPSAHALVPNAAASGRLAPPPRRPTVG